MAVLPERACDWEVEVCGECPPFTNLSEESQAFVEAMAVDRLWKWTGRRFGSCPVTVRPCRRTCWGDWWGYPLVQLSGVPLLDDVDVPLFDDLDQLLTSDQNMAVIGAYCGRCRSDDCSCVALSEALLPGPVNDVEAVWLYGQLMDPSRYRVDDHYRLVRIDGGEWPRCQNLQEEFDGPGAWSVTFTYGQPVPPGGSLVAGLLACELAKALCNDGTCQLPKRLQTITRQGLTVAVLDPFQGLENGMTGIWVIDDWVRTQNGAKLESVVTSPDLPRQRVTTWTGSPSS